MKDHLIDYHISLKLNAKDTPFHALIMAAMQRADSFNIEKLKRAFPKLWEELQERYDAPGGILESDGFGKINIEQVLKDIDRIYEKYE